MARDIDLDERERTYKLAAADRLQQAAGALDSGDEKWTQLLRTAFVKDNNLVGWRAHDPFLKWVEDQPNAAAEALQLLWHDPGPASVDAFAAAVPDEVLHGTGARLSVASFLLSAGDITSHPQ